MGRYVKTPVRLLRLYRQVFTATGVFIPTATHLALGGIINVELLVGAGGGAGGVDATNSATSGAGAGAQVRKNRTLVLSGATAITIGTGGVGGTTAGTAGAVGGDSTIGALLTAYGGGSGCGSAASSLVKGVLRWGGGGQSGTGSTGGNGSGAGSPCYGAAAEAFQILTSVASYYTNPTGLLGGWPGCGTTRSVPGQGIDGYGCGGQAPDNNQFMAIPAAASVPIANSGNGGNGVGGSGATARAGSNGADGIAIISWWDY